jgi:hypothetical protein
MDSRKAFKNQHRHKSKETLLHDLWIMFNKRKWMCHEILVENMRLDAENNELRAFIQNEINEQSK